MRPPVLEISVHSRKFKTVLITAAFGAFLAMAPAAGAMQCAPGAQQVFAQFGDASYYTLLPNGGFESGKTAWTTTGSATVAVGNEPFNLSGKGASSLTLPAGASATSPVFCIQAKTPTMRFVRRLAAGAGGTLRLDAVVAGVPLSLGTISGTSTAWAPSPVVNLWLSSFTVLAPQGALDIQFRVTAISGTWQIDDVFLDPLKRV